MSLLETSDVSIFLKYLSTVHLEKKRSQSNNGAIFQTFSDWSFFNVVLYVLKQSTYIQNDHQTVITINYLGNHKCFPYICKIYFSNIMFLVPTIKSFIALKILQKYVMLID